MRPDYFLIQLSTEDELAVLKVWVQTSRTQNDFHDNTGISFTLSILIFSHVCNGIFQGLHEHCNTWNTEQVGNPTPY